MQDCCDRRTFLGHSLKALTAAYGLRPLLSVAASLNAGGPLAPKPGHHPAKANRLLWIHLTGGMSQVDTFDPKPKLREMHGQEMEVPSSYPLSKEIVTRPALGSPWEFKRCGESGLMISDLFPLFRERADDLCVIRTMHTDLVEHFQATMAMKTGSPTLPLPSLGSWLSYGLGTVNQNLPPYVVLCAVPPYGGSQGWDSSFLPPFHQGTRITPGDDPVPHLKPQSLPARVAELEARMLRDVNQLHADLHPEDLNLRARMRSFDTARGMMQVAPEVFDISREDPKILDLYGAEPGDRKSLGYQCLVARRLLEKGVRVVEIVEDGADGNKNWDAHVNLKDRHETSSRKADQAMAAALTDLRQRGLLTDTLVAITSEFGRTPWTNSGGEINEESGRHHWGHAFTSLLAGGGVKGGMTHGETNEFGSEIVEKGVHVHDYHATILYLMGIDHERLTYRYGGRDFRLTDVHGRVLRDILA